MDEHKPILDPFTIRALVDSAEFRVAAGVFYKRGCRPDCPNRPTGVLVGSDGSLVLWCTVVGCELSERTVACTVQTIVKETG